MGKFTPERTSIIIRALREGNTQEVSSRLAGISRTLFRDWRTKGKEGDPRYAQFAEDIDNALAEAEAEMVARVRTASFDTWQAAAWWLERRKPDDWGKREPKTDTTPANAGFDLSRLSIADMRTYYQLRLKGATEDADIVECKRHLEALEGVQ